MMRGRSREVAMPIAHHSHLRLSAARSLAAAAIAGAMVSVLIGATAGAEPASHPTTGRVGGRVTSKATGQPVPRAVVTIPAFHVRATSDRTGAFAFASAIPTRWPYRRLRVVIVAEG